jgi:hypothetical protein
MIRLWRTSSSSLGVLSLWSLALAVALLAPIASTDASLWSYWGSAGEEDDASDLVSPIVNRELQVQVQAPWPSSPSNILCEAHVFLRSWDFLDTLASASTTTTSSTTTSTTSPLDDYEQATTFAVQVASDAGITNPLLHFALTMRAQSPTCEMHRGLAASFGTTTTATTTTTTTTTTAFCVVNGHLVTALDDLPATVDDLSAEERTKYLLPGEVPRPTTTTTTTSAAGGLVVLYANLGSPEFATWYQTLVANDWPLIVRHLGAVSKEEEEEATTTTTTTMLQGYGVRLDIRNIEYKVFDEKKNEEEEAAAMVNVSTLETLVAPHVFLAGVNLTALVGSMDTSMENITALQADLWKIHQAQQQHMQRMIPPTWQRRQLSLQAATAIASSHTNNNDNNDDNNQLLLTLQEVSQNLPSVASTLVHITVPEHISKVADAMEGVLQQMIQQSGGGLFINGRPMIVERPSFNVFEMIQRLQLEQDHLDRLQNTLEPYYIDDVRQDSSSHQKGQTRAALELIQAAWSKGDDFFLPDKDTNVKEDNDNNNNKEEEEGTSNAHVRINVEQGEKGAVIYVNDIEEDATYEHWPKQVQRALMAMQYGMAPSVRRNLFTILVVENPILTTPSSGVNMGKNLAMQLIQGQFPARLAVLIADDRDIELCAEWVRETHPQEGVPCPNPGTSWLDHDTTPSTNELMAIAATPRDIHRLYAYMVETYEGNREIMQAYEQYMGPTLTKNFPSNGEFLSVFDALGVHNEILVGLQFLRDKVPTEDLAKALLDIDDNDDSGCSYFKGIRFAVDKGLKSGMSFLNGRPLPASSDTESGERVSTLFMEEQEVIFGMIMTNDITDTGPRSVYRKLLSGNKGSKGSKNVFPRVHPLLTAPSDGAYLELDHKFGSESLLIPKTMEGAPLEKDAVVIVDAVLALDTKKGKAIAKTFLDIMENIAVTSGGSSVAVAYRVIPSTVAAATSPLCPIFATASAVGADGVKEALENSNDLTDAASSDSPCAQTVYLKGDLPSDNFLVANGRVYNIEGTSLDSIDVELLLSIHMDHSTAVTQMVKDYVNADSPYDAVARTTSFLSVAKASTQGRSSPVDTILSFEKQLDIEDNPLRFTWNGDCEGDRLKVCMR